MTSSVTVKLASGHQMPLVGFGLWKVPKESAAEIVYNVSYITLGKAISNIDGQCAMQDYSTNRYFSRPSRQDTVFLTGPTIIKTRRKQERVFVGPSGKVS